MFEMEQIKADYYHYPMYIFYKDRLETFPTWPTQIKPNKHELAEAGFFYSGCNDTVVCFSCGLQLCQWKSSDTALKEHSWWSCECVFLNMIGPRIM